MGPLMQYMPLVVFIGGLFTASVGLAVALTMWIMMRLAEQDARRTEIKEILLVEIRNNGNSLREHMDRQHAAMWDKINDLTTRLTRVETKLP